MSEHKPKLQLHALKSVLTVNVVGELSHRAQIEAKGQRRMPLYIDGSPSYFSENLTAKAK